MKKIYLASPLGFSEVGRSFMYDKLIPILQQQGIEVIDPWKLTAQEQVDSVLHMPYGQEKKEAWKKLNSVIGKNNEKGLQEADGVVAILDGVDVDSGTASEIGYAAALDKPIVGYRGDFRLAADNEGSIVNLQVEYFITKNGGVIVTSLEELQTVLKNIFGE